METKTSQLFLSLIILLLLTNCQNPSTQLEFHEPEVNYEFKEITEDMHIQNFLVGQWITPSHDRLYFSPSNKQGMGAYVLEQAQHTENSKLIPTRRFIHYYQIFQVSEDGMTMDIIYAFETGQKRLSRYILSKNKKYLTNLTLIGELEIKTMLKRVNSDYIPK
jgi:hypothetical protein